MKKVIISGGGTGGHIFPALSIAHALRFLDKDVEILFVGAEGKMEMEKVPEAGFRIIGLPVQGLKRKVTKDNVKVLLNLVKSVVRARKIIREFKPDVVIGVGGYASGPVGMAAIGAKIPVVLQEQNSYAGVTNKYLAKKARKVCVAYEGMDRFFKSSKIIFTGNPVRKDLLNSQYKRTQGLEYYELENDKTTILVTGGSLGARTLNRMMELALKEIGTWSNVQVLWQCGAYYYDILKKEYEGRLPANIRLTAFLKHMDLAYACADIVVARAGAGTISELCLLGKASILIPSPNVAEDHQTSNALALVKKDAAVMIRDVEAAEKFLPAIKELVDNKERREELSQNIAGLAIKDSDILIAREVLQIIEEKENRKN